jgi:hypothetical protein
MPPTNAGMRQTLKLHPDSHCAAVTGIAVEVVRPNPAALLLSYEVTGEIGRLSIPPRVAHPARADELWRHMCFEAFVSPAPGAAYYEFNFAPSFQWAAYRFDGYRKGMRIAAEIAAPRIEARSASGRYTLEAAVTLSRAADARWRVGLAAVIEGASGRLSYWALAHSPGKPDFHRADCFVCEI